MPSRLATKRAKTTKAGRPRKVTKPVYEAKVTLRQRILPSLAFHKDSEQAKAFQKIVKLMGKLQDNGRYNGERANRIRIVESICEKHNINLDDALLEVERQTNKYEPGRSYVLIKRTDKKLDKSVRFQSFVTDLLRGLEQIYECNTYDEKGRRKGHFVRVVFYGLPENIFRASNNFVDAYNKIMRASMNYPGLSARNSYCLGNADTIEKRGNAYTKSFLDQIKRAEVAANESFNDNGDDEDMEEGVGAGLNTNQMELKKDMTVQVLGGAEDDVNDDATDENKQIWRHEAWINETRQIAIQKVLIDDAAQRYLDKHNIKVRKIRKRHNVIKCDKSYKQGQIDGEGLMHSKKAIKAALAAAALTQIGQQEPSEEDEDSDAGEAA